MPGARIGGRCINNLRYADDTALVTESKEDINNLLNSKMEEFKLGDDEFDELVDSLIFLVSNIHNSGDCGGEMQRTLYLGRTAMAKLDNIWKDKDVTIATKPNTRESLGFPVVMYGSES